jgi:hypothetical protein
VAESGRSPDRGRPFDDYTLIFYPADDPFTLRFHVRPIVWLPLEKTTLIHTDTVWNSLSFTQKHPKRSLTWTGNVRSSLTRVSDADGTFLESLLRSQVAEDGVHKGAAETQIVTAHLRAVEREITRLIDAQEHL